MKKQFLILFAFISVLAFSQVPQRFNKVIVTGDITSPKFIKTGSNSDSVLLGNGSARAISTIKTDTVSLSNRINAKATGTGTVNGTNTGDETLTSIKTKLGAATSVSDGYLKYQDFALLHTPTTVTAENGLSISGQNISLKNANPFNSGALTVNDWNTFNSKEPSFSKNTAFNKNFGTTTGTVLEGRTFGTAANSAIGDFIQNQNSSAQTARMWINGSAKIDGGLALLNRYDNSSNGSIIFNSGSGADFIFAESAPNIYAFGSGGYGSIVAPTLSLNISTRAATFSSTVNSTGFLLNGNNLTSSLTTNNIPKWNGSNFVNSLISDDGGIVSITQSSTPQIDFYNSVKRADIRSTSSTLFINSVTGNDIQLQINGTTKFTLSTIGDIALASTTPSTAPTNGALVVDGGIGADHVRANNFYGNGSNLTGVQLPITLTTNGTSGAATFSGNVLNVPNYGNVATSGHYTPTLTNTANIASSSIIADANYSRIGNIVTITLSANVTPTLIGTLTHLTFTLPIATVSTSQQYIGSGVAWFGSSSSIGTFSVESASTAVFRFAPTTTSTSAVSGTFQYRID